jgi:DNA-binding protein HU-beta
VNKEELVTRIAESASVNKKTANEILDATVASIVEAVAAGEKITLVGFGTFEARDRAEREGRNPKTGEKMTIAATRVPAFSPGKIFKDRVALASGKGEAVKEKKPDVKEEKSVATGKQPASAGGQKAGGKKNS